MSNYIWEDRYESALTATDPFLLKMYVARTREIMEKRMAILAIREHPIALLEYEAIHDAQAQMKVLERTFEYGH